MKMVQSGSEWGQTCSDCEIVVQQSCKKWPRSAIMGKWCKNMQETCKKVQKTVQKRARGGNEGHDCAKNGWAMRGSAPVVQIVQET